MFCWIHSCTHMHTLTHWTTHFRWVWIYALCCVYIISKKIIYILKGKTQCCLFSMYFPFLSYQKTPCKSEVLEIVYQYKKRHLSATSADEVTRTTGAKASGSKASRKFPNRRRTAPRRCGFLLFSLPAEPPLGGWNYNSHLETKTSPMIQSEGLRMVRKKGRGMGP